MNKSRIEKYDPARDRTLHQTLSKIFRDRRLSDSQIKEFLRGPQQNTDHKAIIWSIMEFFRGPRQNITDHESIIKSIMGKKPNLIHQFSDEEFGKLSLLWIAVLAGYRDSAELLVRLGANVKEPFGRHYPQVISKKWTILQQLIYTGHLYPENERLVCLVMDHGVDLEIRDSVGRTVLHHAVMGGQVRIAKMLLEKGANVNAKDNEDKTPLLLAICNSKANELLPLLIKHGADVFVKDLDERNALHWLALLPSFDTEHATNVTKILIEKGASLDDVDYKQYQPIHWAVTKGKNELIEIFVDHGANVNAQVLNGKQYFPLYFAALTVKYPSVVQTLLKLGANVDQKTSAGRTALHAICTCVPHWFCKKTIRSLLSAGADVLAEDCHGKTPFALMNLQDVEDLSIKLIIKAMVLKKVCQPSLELKDEKIIMEYPMLWQYYRGCFEEIDRMKLTRFIKTCTFFELLIRSHCQIAEFMRNPNFETKFQQYHLSESFMYAEEINRAFRRAQHHYQATLELEDIISEAVDNILPDLVVRKIACYAFNECCNNVI